MKSTKATMMFIAAVGICSAFAASANAQCGFSQRHILNALSMLNAQAALTPSARGQSTVQEARDAREAIVGSFDVLIARGGHRTNEIMKVLTLTSVILLPGALLAGVMGMNFKVGLFDNATLFWVVLAVIVAIAPVTIGFAKRRSWI